MRQECARVSAGTGAREGVRVTWGERAASGAMLGPVWSQSAMRCGSLDVFCDGRFWGELDVKSSLGAGLCRFWTRGGCVSEPLCARRGTSYQVPSTVLLCNKSTALARTARFLSRSEARPSGSVQGHWHGVLRCLFFAAFFSPFFAFCWAFSSEPERCTLRPGTCTRSQSGAGRGDQPAKVT